MMERDRYWQLGGMDEAHGSWGQMGVEVACKSWLSGGKLMCTKNTWFAHMFRTQPGFGFPYKMTTSEQSRNRSQDMWYNNKWSGQKYKLSWLLERFWPVPGWTDADLKKQKDREK